VVSLTGKNSTASWFQINYASGPDGHGWITAQYVQTDAAADLPVLDDYGTPVTPGPAETPSGPAMTPMPTIGPAFADGDSQAAPAVQVTFSATGTRQFTYSSQVSAPDGDAEDWVEFTPYAASGTNARLTFSLTCSGNDILTVELWQGGSALSGWGGLECGDLDKPVTLPAGQAYLITGRSESNYPFLGHFAPSLWTKIPRTGIFEISILFCFAITHCFLEFARHLGFGN
jgi:hypothetical protein